MAVKIRRGVGRPSGVARANTAFAVSVGEELQRQQVQGDFVATGDSLDSYEAIVRNDDSVELQMDSYLAYSIAGTGSPPGGDVRNVGELAKWIEVKNIKPPNNWSVISFAWAIAKKHQAEGNQVYRNERRGMDLIGAIEDGFDRVGDQVATIIADESADKLIAIFKKA